MVTDIVNVNASFFSVLDTGKNTADVRLANGSRPVTPGPEAMPLRTGSARSLFLILDRGSGEHSDILQTLHMGQIALTEGHEEADALDSRTFFARDSISS